MGGHGRPWAAMAHGMGGHGRRWAAMGGERAAAGSAGARPPAGSSRGGGRPRSPPAEGGFSSGGGGGLHFVLVRARSCSSPSSAPPTLPLLRCSAAPLLQRRSGGASLPRRSPAPRVRARARQSISLGELRGGGDLHDELEPSGAAPKEATSLGTRAPAGARVAHGHGAPPSWGARGGSWLLGGYTWPARGAPRLRLPAGRGRRGRLPPVRRGAASVARTEGLRRRLPLPVISFFPFSFFQLRSDSRIDILFRKIPQFSVSPSDWTGLQQREGAAAAVLGPRLDSRLSQVSRGPRRRGGGGGSRPLPSPGCQRDLARSAWKPRGPWELRRCSAAHPPASAPWSSESGGAW